MYLLTCLPHWPQKNKQLTNISGEKKQHADFLTMLLPKGRSNLPFNSS